MLDPALPRATRWTGWRNTANSGARAAVDQLGNNCAEPPQFLRSSGSADQNAWLASILDLQKLTGPSTARQFIRISDKPWLRDHCVWMPGERIALPFTRNEHQVVGRFHEVSKIGFCHV